MAKPADSPGDTVVERSAHTILQAFASQNAVALHIHLANAIYDANINNGGAALDLCLAILRQAQVPITVDSVVEALNSTGFAAWIAGKEPPTIFAQRRHVALRYEVGDCGVFVAALRAPDADEAYLRHVSDDIRMRILAELAATEEEWPREEAATPELRFQRVDFLARELRARLMAAGLQGVEEGLLNAWGEQSTYSSAAQRMRQILEQGAAADVFDVLQERGYVIQGLAQEPTHISDPHWGGTYRLLDEE